MLKSRSIPLSLSKDSFSCLSGFNVHRSRRVQPDEREDLERLVRYIIRNLFSIEKMEVKQPGGPIIYRSGMNEKIHRNFEVFSPCDFIAAITQHIPDKSCPS